MQDRHLFRGRRLDNGKWVTGTYYDDRYIIDSHDDNGGFGSNRELICNAYEVDPATVGQCTGLKDKNGKLIFEGDIVYFWEVNATVCWFDGSWMACFSDDEGDEELLEGISYDCEIIGNIHDEQEG